MRSEGQAKRLLLAQKCADKAKDREDGEIYEAVSVILLTLWDRDDLVDLIKQEHDKHCANCAVRREYEHRKQEASLAAERDTGEPRKSLQLGDVVKWLLWALLAVLAIFANVTNTNLPSITGSGSPSSAK